jgi:hypothetical protein
VLTLVPVSFVLLSQVVSVWFGGGEAVPGQRAGAAVVAVVFVMSIAMLMRIAYAGVVFDGQQTDPANDGRAKPQMSGKRQQY